MVERTLAQVEQRIKVRRHNDNFIGNEWVLPVKGQKFENISLIDGTHTAEHERIRAVDLVPLLGAAVCPNGG